MFKAVNEWISISPSTPALSRHLTFVDLAANSAIDWTKASLAF